MELSKLLFLSLILLSNQTFGFNILWIAGLTSPSHQLWVKVLQKTLASRGHNVTALSVDVDNNITPNLTFIHLENVYKHFSTSSTNLTQMMKADPFKAITSLAMYRADGCIPAFESQGFKTLMSYPDNFKFDLVLHDFAGAHCLLGFVSKFKNPPLISISASTCPIAISSASGNPQYPGYVPANHLNVGFQMNFGYRIYNTLLYIYDNFVRTVSMMPEQDRMARVYFKNENLNVETISRSSVLTMVNLPPYDVLQPFFQTVIPVGGLQIQKPKPLNEKLTEFISGAKDGVIYFALGTNIKAETFSQTKIKYFLKAFEFFPTYRFLWKYDPNAMIHSIPENILLEKWMPQNDILAHPKTKLFIGHGGALSCQEATWYGIPQLLIPFIIDQKHNAARAVERGIALQLDHNEINLMTIVNALSQLLNEPDFRKNAETYSKIFRDQPQSPLERAIFWIEYVLRNGFNTTVLRSPGQDMTVFYQMIPDAVIAFSVILVIVMIKSVFFSSKD